MKKSNKNKETKKYDNKLIAQSCIILFSLIVICSITVYADDVYNVNITNQPIYTNTDTAGNYTFNMSGTDLSYYNWFVNDSIVSSGSTNETNWNLSNGNFSKNYNITLEIIPSNGTNGTASNSSTIIVQNSLPGASSVNITPTTAFTNNSLTGAYTFSDNDTDTNSSFVNWYVNNALTASNTILFLSGNFSKNDNIIFEVVPNDGTSNGTAVNSSTLTISNSVPTSASSINPAGGETFTSTAANSININWTAGTDTDGDPLKYWLYYSNNSGSSYTRLNVQKNISNLVHHYKMDEENNGDDVFDSVTNASSGICSSCFSFPNSGLLSGARSFPNSVGQGNLGAFLRTGNASISVWIYVNKTIDSTNQFWYQCSSGTANCLELKISGTAVSVAKYVPNDANTTTVSYTPGSWTVGQWYHIVYTFDDSERNMSLYVNNTFVNSSYYSGTLTGSTPPTRYIGRNLNGNNDADDIWLDDYRFYSTLITNYEIGEIYNSHTGIASNLINSEDGSTNLTSYNWNTSDTNTYPSSIAYRVRVVTGDGTDNATSNVSSSSDFEIRHNTAPSLSSIQLLPSTIYTNNTANCSGVYNDTDVDSGTVFYNFYINSTANKSGSLAVSDGDFFNFTLASSNFVKTNNVTCEVWASDNLENSSKTNTSKVIMNNPPTGTPNIVLPVAGSYPTGSLNLEWTAVTDIDGDTITYNVEYLAIGGSYISIVNTTSLTYTWQTGELTTNTYYIRVTPTDGTNTSTANTSDAFTLTEINPPMLFSTAGAGPPPLASPGDEELNKTPITIDACDIKLEIGEINLDESTYDFELSNRAGTQVSAELLSDYKNYRMNTLENTIIRNYPLILDDEPALYVTSLGCNQTILLPLKVSNSDHSFSKVVFSIFAMVLGVALITGVFVGLRGLARRMKRQNRRLSRNRIRRRG